MKNISGQGGEGAGRGGGEGCVCVWKMKKMGGLNTHTNISDNRKMNHSETRDIVVDVLSTTAAAAVADGHLK